MKPDHFERFWSVFPNRKGKLAAKKAFEKAVKGEDIGEFTQMICLAIEAQQRYRADARSSGEFIPPWKQPATWINSGCWDDEVKSHTELKQRVELGKCKCSKPVHGAPFQHCTDCLPHENIYIQEKTKFMQESGLIKKDGETTKDWIERCRTYCLQYIEPLRRRL